MLSPRGGVNAGRDVRRARWTPVRAAVVLVALWPLVVHGAATTTSGPRPSQAAPRRPPAGGAARRDSTTRSAPAGATQCVSDWDLLAQVGAYDVTVGKADGGGLGLGLRVERTWLVVSSIQEGTPAAAVRDAGQLHVGSALLGIGKESVLGKPAPEVARLILAAGPTVVLRVLRVDVPLLQYSLWGTLQDLVSSRGGGKEGTLIDGEVPHVYEVEIIVGSRGLGVTLGASTGGVGTVVAAIANDGPAQASGCFEKGDVFVALSDKSTLKAPAAGVAARLRSLGGTRRAKLLMWRAPPSQKAAAAPRVASSTQQQQQQQQQQHGSLKLNPGEFVVTLNRAAGGSIGLGLGTAGAGPKAKVVVLTVVHGGVAHASGQVQEGDEVLGVGGDPADANNPVRRLRGNGNLDKATEMIRALPDGSSVSLLLRRGSVGAAASAAAAAESGSRGGAPGQQQKQQQSKNQQQQSPKQGRKEEADIKAGKKAEPPPPDAAFSNLHYSADGSVSFDVSLKFPAKAHESLGVELAADAAHGKTVVFIRSVRAHTAAAKTKALRTDDQITAVDGIKVQGAGVEWVSKRIAAARAASKRPGQRDSVKLTVRRAPKRQQELEAAKRKAKDEERARVAKATQTHERRFHSSAESDKDRPKCHIFAGQSADNDVRCSAAAFGAPLPFTRTLNLTVVEVVPRRGCSAVGMPELGDNRWKRRQAASAAQRAADARARAAGEAADPTDSSTASSGGSTKRPVPSQPFWAVVERGQCYFHEKALHAQAFGATGLIVVNDAEATEPLGFPRDSEAAYEASLGVEIPVVMVTKSVGQLIFQMLKTSSATAAQAEAAQPESTGVYLAATGKQPTFARGQAFRLQSHFMGGSVQVAFDEEAISRAHRGQEGRAGDETMVVPLSFQEIVSGKRVKFTFSRSRLCPLCHGKGGFHPHLHVCPVCHSAHVDHGHEHAFTHERPEGARGPGHVTWEHNIGGDASAAAHSFVQSRTQTCPFCDGYGEVVDPGFECQTCGGKRVVSDSVDLEWRTPAGAPDQFEKRFKGEGSENPVMRAGDVVLVVRTVPPEGFTRLPNGADVGVELNVTLQQALVGFEANFTNWDGVNVTLAQKGVTAEGDELRVPGKGLPWHETSDPTSKYQHQVEELDKVRAEAQEAVLDAEDAVAEAREAWAAVRSAWYEEAGVGSNGTVSVGVDSGGGTETQAVASSDGGADGSSDGSSGGGDANSTTLPTAPAAMLRAEERLLKAEDALSAATEAYEGIDEDLYLRGDLVVTMNVVFPEVVPDADRAEHFRETFDMDEYDGRKRRRTGAEDRDRDGDGGDDGRGGGDDDTGGQRRRDSRRKGGKRSREEWRRQGGGF